MAPEASHAPAPGDDAAFQYSISVEPGAASTVTRYAPATDTAAGAEPSVSSTVGVIATQPLAVYSNNPQFDLFGLIQFVPFAAGPVGAELCGRNDVKSTSARTMYAAEL